MQKVVQDLVKLKSQKCSECEGSLILVDGEAVCSSCGLVNEVYEFNFDLASSIRSGGFLGKRVDLVDGLGSFIGFRHSYYFQDKGGKDIQPEGQALFSKLKSVYDKRERYSGQGTDYRTLNAIKEASEILGLSQAVRIRAAYLYRKAIKSLKGKHMGTSVAAYCLLLASREFDSANVVTIKEVADVFKRIGHRVSASSIMRAGLYCREALGIKLRTRKSEEYLEKALCKIFSNEEIIGCLKRANLNPFQLKEKLFQKSLELLRKLNSPKLKILKGGRSPEAIAVSAIYAAARSLSGESGLLPITQKRLANATGVAEYTIRSHYRDLFKTL